MKKVVLASSSPRRNEILKRARIPFVVDPGDYAEDMSLNLPPDELVRHLALGKAESMKDTYPNAVIIGADSIVILDGMIFGKPHTKEEAKEMLKKLSGKKNSVITGYAIIDAETGSVVTNAVEAFVYFREISEEEIDAYIATGEPFDKAGAYHIQGAGGMFIEKIEGDHTAILGLPLWPVVRSLKQFGIEPFQEGGQR